MKTITEKTLLRIANTRTICAQLPEVFTKSQYEELRRLQAHGLRELWMKETGMRYKTEGYFAKEEGAFTLDNLKTEGFLILVKVEKITKTVQTWEYGKGYIDQQIEVERHYYRLSEEIEDFFEKTLDI